MKSSRCTAIVLGVKEYFLFDPFEDYLDPPIQGYRLRKGAYVPIKPVNGRLPSQVTGLAPGAVTGSRLCGREPDVPANGC